LPDHIIKHLAYAMLYKIPYIKSFLKLTVSEPYRTAARVRRFVLPHKPWHNVLYHARVVCAVVRNGTAHRNGAARGAKRTHKRHAHVVSAHISSIESILAEDILYASLSWGQNKNT
jgi:hypothetical protein